MGLGGKRIPPAWRAWDQKAKRALLAGLVDSDGSVYYREEGHPRGKHYPSARGAITYATISRQLMREVRDLCRDLGVEMGISSHLGKRKNRIYQGTVRRRSLHAFQRLIPLQSTKQEKLNRLCEILPEREFPKGVRQIGSRYYAYRWENGRQIHLGGHATVEAATAAVKG